MTPHANILTRYAPLSALPADGMGNSRAWLSGAERAELSRFRDASRRQQWLCGRSIAKQLVAEAHGEESHPADIEILTRDHRGLGARPQIIVQNRLFDWSLSISHTKRGALAALSTTPGSSIGVDLVGEVPSDDRFLRAWFTPNERRWIQSEPERRTAVLWSVKEAIYKACHTGQGWSPRIVMVDPQPQNQFACHLDGHPLHELQVTIHEMDHQVAALAVTCRPVRRQSAGAIFENHFQSVEADVRAFASCL